MKILIQKVLLLLLGIYFMDPMLKISVSIKMDQSRSKVVNPGYLGIKGPWKIL